MALSLSALYVIASLSISGVYYDPIQAEAGGEAIQLHNNGQLPLSLDSVSVATKQSTYPLPTATLLPGSGYLIADTNWSGSRDNSSWPLADLELPLSLANTDGYVHIVQGNTTLDSISWNSSFKAKEGRMLTRQGDAEPFFWNSSTTVNDLEARVVVLDGAPLISNITITDDAPQPGVQLLSYNRTVYVSAVVTDVNGQNLSVTVEFFGQEYELAGNSSFYAASLPFSSAAPGKHTVTVRASRSGASSESSIDITVLSSVSIGTSGNLVFVGAPGSVANSSLTVFNDGNVQKHVTLQLQLPQAVCDATSIDVNPGQRVIIHCNATIPSANAGNYTYPVRLIAS